MNPSSEKAIVVMITTAVADLVADRVTWDEEDLDTQFDYVSLRTLSEAQGSRDLTSRGGTRRSLLEVGCNSATSGGASTLCGRISASFAAYESGPFTVTTEDGDVSFGCVLLESEQQSAALRERSYRKTALFTVWLNE